LSINVVLLEPCFPHNQREFARALSQVGARVIGIGERPKSALDDSLRSWLSHYEQVGNVTRVSEVVSVLKRLRKWTRVDRLEATIEAHVSAAADLRAEFGIPGTSQKTTFLCRDKPAMKDALRAAGIPCAQSLGADSRDEIFAFAAKVGFPLIVKPRDAAGASGTIKAHNTHELDQALTEFGIGRIPGRSVAVEEFIEGHEGFYDTISIDGDIAFDFASHYYPNVLEAMRERWISPQFIATNRIDNAEGYVELKKMGRDVNRALGIGTSATHMEWFFGSKGLKFSEIGCRPPGVRAWDLYAQGNELDIYREWAMAIVHRKRSRTPSRRYSAGLIAIRPSQDGHVVGYDGVEKIRRHLGNALIDIHLPPPGSRTQPVAAGYMANAWLRAKHEDYDALRGLLNDVGETLKMIAR
jgi:carbamoylphosphate synthase large subunit